jgi:RNA methyltransferase, TrmH family
LCLVEGKKLIVEAKDQLEFSFTTDDTENFNKLVTTETPQDMAGVARLPEWSQENIIERDIIVVLDEVQDPGNVGVILRLCLGFNASLILIESADPGNPKVIRASAGSMFQVPWLSIKSAEALDLLKSINRLIFRLENKPAATVFNTSENILPAKFILITGSEGQGIKLAIKSQSIKIKHDPKLESLNVTSALAIILSAKYQ